MKALFAAVALAAGTLALGANAQTAPQAPQPAPATAPAATAPQQSEAVKKLREACATDVKKFCGTVEAGKGKVRACLDSHEKELSATCKDARAARAAKGETKGKS